MNVCVFACVRCMCCVEQEGSVSLFWVLSFVWNSLWFVAVTVSGCFCCWWLLVLVSVNSDVSVSGSADVIVNIEVSI